MVVTVDTSPAPAEVHRGAGESVGFWVTGHGVGELRTAPLRTPGPDEVRVRTWFTGVSRGTEALVARGEVPVSEHERMRAPFQEGAFPFPVKYGYLNVGVVEEGPAALRDRVVFSLAPHQSASVLPASAVTLVPGDVPARRAVLAGAVETAANVLWDAAPVVGDRIAIVGAGMVGGAVARLAGGIPGADVVLVDVDPARAATAAVLGVGFALADDAADLLADRDVVIEASGTAAGLALALRLAATDGEVVVASWFGSRPVPLELGADFHARRLTLRSSQVGAVAPRRRERRTHRERLALAMRLLADPAFEALLGASSDWRELPELVAALAAGDADPLCRTIDWSAA